MCCAPPERWAGTVPRGQTQPGSPRNWVGGGATAERARGAATVREEPTRTVVTAPAGGGASLPGARPAAAAGSEASGRETPP